MERSNASRFNARQVTDDTFDSTNRNMHGFSFQVGLIQLYALRAKKMGYEFRLASEMDAADKFDDVVFDHIVGNNDEHYWSFVQTKHKLDDNATIKGSELEEIIDKPPFGIAKYFLSFVLINRNFENKYKKENLKDFVMVTNANFDFEATIKGKPKPTLEWNDLFMEDSFEENDNDILNLRNFAVNRYRFSDKNDKLKLFIRKNLVEIPKNSKHISQFAAIQKLFELSAKNLSCTTAFEECFAEFVQKFRFVTNFPNEVKLREYNESLLKGGNKLWNVDLANSAFIERILDLMNSKKGENVYLTNRFEDELLSEINGILASGFSMAYCEDLDAHKMHFDEESSNFDELSKNLNKFLNGEQQERQVIYLRTQSTLLSAIKVRQILKRHGIYKNKDGFILIPFKKLLHDRIKQFVFDALRNRKSHHLLVIYFEDEKTLISIDDQVKDILDELLTLLKEIESKKSSSENGIESKKKIILISQNPENWIIGKKDQSKPKDLDYQEEKDTTLFKDLDCKSQNVVLGTKVNFQGTIMNLSELIDRDYGVKFFDAEIVTRLLNGNKLKIGNENVFSSSGYVEDDYIGNPQMYESTVTTSTPEKKKKMNYDETNESEVKWIVHINAIDLCSNELVENNDERFEKVAKMAIPGDATEDIDIEIQQTLFKSSFNAKFNFKRPKIELMVEKICPNYELNVNNLIEALKKSNPAKIRVKTRPCQCHLQKVL
ncbi:uncharacterized protein LOC129571120 [Sitodiplosis mosellana]|uniref:uncharacterized protein LOC129571120 n=1 Tax=Sitodiplosis mosellana TaxID=263140 RepID=UPI00244470D4|nr:uncharacterized protein LOC129571120 [Sitodiplosis mosellana]